MKSKQDNATRLHWVSFSQGKLHLEQHTMTQKSPYTGHNNSVVAQKQQFQHAVCYVSYKATPQLLVI